MSPVKERASVVNASATILQKGSFQAAVFLKQKKKHMTEALSILQSLLKMEKPEKAERKKKNIALKKSTLELVFVSSNKGKQKEAKKLLNGFNLKFLPLELKEIQGSIKEIAIKKAEEASKLAKQKGINSAIFVEDTCLVFNAFKELPGPYIKSFIKCIGTDKLPLLLSSFEDKSAKAICTIAYKEQGKKPIVFQGIVNGKIVKKKGSNGFAWDPIFQPATSTKTFAEMSTEEKNKISHRKKAFEKLKAHILKKATR